MTLHSQEFRRFSMSEKSTAEAKAVNSELLAKQTEEYKAGGGKINKIPIGKSSFVAQHNQPYYDPKDQKLRAKKSASSRARRIMFVDVGNGARGTFDSIRSAEEKGFYSTGIYSAIKNNRPYHGKRWSWL